MSKRHVALWNETKLWNLSFRCHTCDMDVKLESSSEPEAFYAPGKWSRFHPKSRGSQSQSSHSDPRDGHACTAGCRGTLLSWDWAHGGCFHWQWSRQIQLSQDVVLQWPVQQVVDQNLRSRRKQPMPYVDREGPKSIRTCWFSLEMPSGLVDGSGQNARELWENLGQRYPKHRVCARRPASTSTPIAKRCCGVREWASWDLDIMWLTAAAVHST